MFGGLESSLPIFVAPAALARLGHPDGEMNLTRAAGAEGILQSVILPANWRENLVAFFSARENTESLLEQALHAGETWENLLECWRTGDSAERRSIILSLLEL